MCNGKAFFEFEPGTEQEVVALFGFLLPHLPIKILINEIRTAFPDCLATDAESGAPVRIEFELIPSNFRLHGHEITRADYIICWEDDDCITEGPKVIALKPILKQAYPNFFKEGRPKFIARAWTPSAFEGEAVPEVLEHIKRIAGLISGSKNLALRNNGRGKEATVNVCLLGSRHSTRDPAKLLWIWSDGRYQWCWEFFRERSPGLVKAFQTFVSSTNKSSSYEKRRGALLDHSPSYFSEIALRVAALACES